MTTPGNFLLAMRAWKASAKKARNGRYAVRRGGVVWEAWDFTAYPFAISLQCEVRDFGRELNEGSVAIEIASAIPQDQSKVSEIDDEILDEMAADAEWILKDWKRSVDEIGAFIFKCPPGSIEELHDGEYRVQGIIAKTKIGF